MNIRDKNSSHGPILKVLPSIFNRLALRSQNECVSFALIFFSGGVEGKETCFIAVFLLVCKKIRCDF